MIDAYATFEPYGACEFVSEGKIPSHELQPPDLVARRPGIAQFRQWVLQSFGGAGLGVGRACAGDSATDRHQESKAWDWQIASPEAADRLIAELLADDQDGNKHALARRFGIRNIIYDRAIWTAPAPGWTPYHGQSAHTDHVHFDFSTAGAMGRTSAYTTRPVPLIGKEQGRPAIPFRDPGDDPGGGTVEGAEVAVALYRWTTTGDGCVLVDKHDGKGLQLPTLPAGRLTELADSIAEQWGRLATSKAAVHGAPLSWVLGSIFRESGGDPDAVSPAGAVGLMQIMPGIHGLTADELRDPATNVDKGAELLGQSAAAGYDLPQSLSRYNAGAEPSGRPHPSTSSPWGIAENTGHISAVVAAHNYYLGKLCRAGVPSGFRLGPLLAFGSLLGFAVVKNR